MGGGGDGLGRLGSGGDGGSGGGAITTATVRTGSSTRSTTTSSAVERDAGVYVSMVSETLSACDSDFVVMVASTRTLADVTLRVMSSGSTSEKRAAMLTL